MLSYTLTQRILLSTIRLGSNGFETTDCLECLQILDILIYGRRVCCKAGDWILCTMIGYRIPERETYGMLLFIQLLHSCLLRRGKSATCYRYSYTLTYRILLSPTSQQRPGCQQYGNQRFHNFMDLQPMTTSPCRHSTLSLQNGKRFACFPFLSFLILTFS